MTGREGAAYRPALMNAPENSAPLHGALSDVVFRGRRVVFPDGVRPASIHVRRGCIVSVAGFDEVPAGCPVKEAGDLYIMPGLVDTHVHINEPGRTEWEGFASATRAAARGGVTTLLDMPLNSIPPTTSVAGLLAKAAAAEGKLFVDVGFCGGAVPGNAAALRPLAEAGALAFKCFLADSGVPEFGHVGEDDLRQAMKTLAGLGLPLLCHAELPGPIAEQAARLDDLDDKHPGDPRRYATYLSSRPRESEDLAVALICRLSEEIGARAHVVHLSSADALFALRRARDAGVAVSAETCPHYLSLASEEVPDGATEFKCAPPIREGENRERLWDALRQGLVDQVVTDHSPSLPELKCTGSGDFMAAWGGISSLQLGLAVTWTEARRRGRSLVEVCAWMCAAPARLVGLAGRKGSIAVGHDADLIFFDPDAEVRVDPDLLLHRHKLTPYRGKVLAGVVMATYLRGEKIHDRGVLATSPRGTWLRKGSG